VSLFDWFRRKPKAPEPERQFDHCEMCGKRGMEYAGIDFGIIQRPFPVYYCAGCDKQQGDHLHRKCPRCNHTVAMPTAKERHQG